MHGPKDGQVDTFYVLNLSRDTVDFFKGTPEGMTLLRKFHRGDWTGRHRRAIREIVLKTKVLPLMPFELAERFVDRLSVLLPEPPRADLRRTKGFFRQVHKEIAPNIAHGATPLILAGSPGYLGLFKFANRKSGLFEGHMTAQLADVPEDQLFARALNIFRIHQRALQHQKDLWEQSHQPRHDISNGGAPATLGMA